MRPLIEDFLVIPGRLLGKAMWAAAECFGFSWGKLAPRVFGLMIGRKPHRIKPEDQEAKP